MRGEQQQGVPGLTSHGACVHAVVCVCARCCVCVCARSRREWGRKKKAVREEKEETKERRKKNMITNSTVVKRGSKLGQVSQRQPAVRVDLDGEGGRMSSQSSCRAVPPGDGRLLRWLCPDRPAQCYCTLGTAGSRSQGHLHVDSGEGKQIDSKQIGW